MGDALPNMIHALLVSVGTRFDENTRRQFVEERGRYQCQLHHAINDLLPYLLEDCVICYGR